MSDVSEELSEINPYPYEENREYEIGKVVMSAVRSHLRDKE